MNHTPYTLPSEIPTPDQATARREAWPRRARVLLLGALAVALLDGLDAVLFFGLRGVSAVQIFQSIASGILGAAAFRGGVPSALLGAALHVLIAGIIVLTYYLASRPWDILTRHPLASDALYGCLVYAVMNLLVIPASAAVTGPSNLPVVPNGIAIHAFAVGPVSALAARAARCV